MGDRLRPKDAGVYRGERLAPALMLYPVVGLLLSVDFMVVVLRLRSQS